ncbi:MAG: hypothetical protein U1C66_00805 [Patescibacteria group bacterium]|nr:hypothetical protein [Patescibacteria group bacterium]
MYSVRSDMIPDIMAWGKQMAPKLIVPGLVVLVALASFGLGRLSALKAGERGLVIYPSPQTSQTNQ